MNTRDEDARDQTVAERTETLKNELHIPADAAGSAARDRNSPQPTRKPASEDVELERIAAAQAKNAEDDRKTHEG